MKEKDPKEDFLNLPENTIVVKVKRGTKVKNIMGFVEKSLKVFIFWLLICVSKYLIQSETIVQNLCS